MTPALALYDEALAFGTKWAAEHGTATAASAAAAGAGISSTSPVADTQPASGGDSNTAQGEGSAVFPSLYALMSQHVVVQWTSRQLLASGLPDILLEDLYATVGKVMQLHTAVDVMPGMAGNQLQCNCQCKAVAARVTNSPKSYVAM